MADSREIRDDDKFASRTLAVLLVLGSLLGLMGTFVDLQRSESPIGQTLLSVTPFGLFSGALWQGTKLWRGEWTGVLWARAIFAAQIPLLHLPNFTYELTMLLGCAVRFGVPDEPLELSVGTKLLVYGGSMGPPAFMGVNLFPICALVVLLRRVRRRANS